jgi:hypothetical protein
MTRDVTRTAAATGLSFIGEMQAMIYDVRWLLLLCIVLIVTDLKFGIENSHAHGEVIRSSRAMRRTINKFIDYLCWLMFSAVFAEAFAVPFGIDKMVVTVCVMLFACFNEIDSIMQNYHAARGLEGVSLIQFIISLVKKKNKDVGEALEETLNKEKEDGDK